MNYVNDNFNPLVANQIQKSTAQFKTEFIYPMCVKLSEGGGVCFEYYNTDCKL